jgi:hypothetical protein
MIKTTTELKQHIRVISTNDFDNLKPSLRVAQRYIIRVIGQTTWDAALAHYESVNYNNPHTSVDDPLLPLVPEEGSPDPKHLDELVDHIQDALVHYAYWHWSPQAAVILTDSGYQVAQNESLRPAPLALIDRAESSILDTAHSFMEDLLEFLDSRVDEFVFWSGSEEFGTLKGHLINSAREFDAIIPINSSRRLFLELIPFIRIVEQSHILPAVTWAKYDYLIEAQKDGDLSLADKELIAYITPALAYLSLAEALAMLPTEILPGSFTEKISGMQDNTRKMPAKAVLMNAYATKVRDVGLVYLKRLHDYYQASIATLEIPAPSDTSFVPQRTCKSLSI